MSATTMVPVRADENIKCRATETLASMGLTVPDAVRVFLTRVVTDQQLPFALQPPNASTRSAMREARAMGNARSVRVDARSNALAIAAKR